MKGNKFKEYIGEKNYGGSKERQHGYITHYYAAEMEDLRDKELLFVELGVRDGTSLAMFGDWLHKSRVIGIDTKEIYHPGPHQPGGLQYGWGQYDLKPADLPNVEFRKVNAYDAAAVNSFGDNSIDYLVDDASHRLDDHFYLIENYYPKLKEGGKIILEDVGYNQNTNICIPETEAAAYTFGYEYKLYDFRSEQTTDFSVIIELTKERVL